MSSFSEIRERLNDTNATLAQVEAALAANPSPSLTSTARSLRKRRDHLEAEFLEAAEEVGVDVCSYRIFPDQGVQTKLAAVTSTLSDWQTMFSVVYDAVKNGPKRTSHLSAEVLAATSFDFGYSFAGSVGMVFTLPNHRLLFDTPLDKTFEAIFELVHATSREEIVALAQRLGRGPIKLLHDWARDHVKHGVGADIDWRRGREVKANLFIERHGLLRLQETIARTSEAQEESMVVEGTLVGADIQRRSFHLERGEHETHIKGTFYDAIGPTQTVELPKRYRATILKTTSVQYATEAEEVSYFLVKLERVTNPPSTQGHMG